MPTIVKNPPQRLVDEDTGSEFSLEYLPNPDEVIRYLNDIPHQLKFEEEMDDGKIVLDTDPINAQTNKNDVLLNRLEELNGIDSTQERLGIYNQAQRVERLNAYRQKRQQRDFGNSKIRYVVRQNASETRVRVNGRFAVTTTSSDQASPAAASAATPAAAAAAPKTTVKQEDEWVFELDVDQPDKMMRRTAASSSTSWIVQHHRKSSALEHQRKRTINSSMGSHADFVTARGLIAAESARASSVNSLGSFVSLSKELCLLESTFLVELDKKPPQ